MDFPDFCNICYNQQNIIKMDTEESKQLLNILISFIGYQEMFTNNVVYVCLSCCKKIKDINKYKGMCIRNFIQFRKSYLQLKKHLEGKNYPDVKGELNTFVHKNVYKKKFTDGKDLKCTKTIDLLMEFEEVVVKQEPEYTLCNNENIIIDQNCNQSDLNQGKNQDYSTTILDGKNKNICDKNDVENIALKQIPIKEDPQEKERNYCAHNDQTNLVETENNNTKLRENEINAQIFFSALDNKNSLQYIQNNQSRIETDKLDCKLETEIDLGVDKVTPVRKNKMAKTSTERVREFRARQRASKLPKKPPKTGAQRTKEYRDRKKAIEKAITPELLLLTEKHPTETMDNVSHSEFINTCYTSSAKRHK